MNFKIEAALARVPPVVCPRIARSGGYTQGILIIIAALAVLYIVVQSSALVQLSIAATGGLLGMLAVRNRHSPAALEVDERAAMYRPTLRTDTSRLAIVGNAMLQKTRKKDQPLSILVLDFSDLPELQIVCKGQVARDLGPSIEKSLQSVAPAKGAVVRTGSTTFTVLLPNFDTRRTLRAVCEAFGKACCLEFALGHNEMLLVPDFIVETLRSGTESVEDVYKVLYGDLVKAQLQEKRWRIHLRRERESHSRPMSSSPTKGARPVNQRNETMPVTPLICGGCDRQG